MCALSLSRPPTILHSDEMAYHHRRPFLTALAHLVAHTPAHVRLIVTAAAAVDIHSVLAQSMSVTEIIDLAPPLPPLPPRPLVVVSAPRAASSTSAPATAVAANSHSASASSDGVGHDDGTVLAENSNTGLPGFSAWHLHTIFSRTENHQLMVPNRSVFELAANIVAHASFGSYSTARQIIAQFAASREVLLLRSHLAPPPISSPSTSSTVPSVSILSSPSISHHTSSSLSLPSSQLSTHTGDGFVAFGAALRDAISGFRPRWRDLAARCFAKHARLLAQRIRCECESQHGQSPTVRVCVF